MLRVAPLEALMVPAFVTVPWSVAVRPEPVAVNVAPASLVIGREAVTSADDVILPPLRFVMEPVPPRVPLLQLMSPWLNSGLFMFRGSPSPATTFAVPPAAIVRLAALNDELPSQVNVPP